MVTVVVKDLRCIKIKSSGRSANRFGCLPPEEEKSFFLWKDRAGKGYVLRILEGVENYPFLKIGEINYWKA